MSQVEKVLYTARADTTLGLDGASHISLIQRVAICFAAGVIGGLAVVLFIASHISNARGTGRSDLCHMFNKKP